MKKVLILGGGLSGLSSAVFLLNSGFQVELIEASPKLGGRTYSYDHNGSKVDNGQHILMGCYNNTLEYIDLIGSSDKFDLDQSLYLNSVDDQSQSYKLRISKYLYPLNHLIGFLKYDLFTIRERVEIIKLLLKIKFNDEKIAEGKTLYEFLIDQEQSQKIISSFWEKIAISTMNTDVKIASAQIFLRLIKIIFFSGNKNANIIIPRSDLSRSLITPAFESISKNNGKIFTSEKAVGFVAERNKIIAVETTKRRIDNFDLIISALPEYSLQKIKIENAINDLILPDLNYSPILSVHLWLSENPLRDKMYDLVAGEFDWLFNHGDHITLLKSSADSLISKDKNDVYRIVLSELKKYFTILTDTEIKDYVMLKEKRATFMSDLDSIEQRKSISNPYSNLFIAGDWTNTDLPSTIEGAIKSGKEVSEKIKML